MNTIPQPTYLEEILSFPLSEELSLTDKINRQMLQMLSSSQMINWSNFSQNSDESSGIYIVFYNYFSEWEEDLELH